MPVECINDEMKKKEKRKNYPEQDILWLLGYTDSVITAQHEIRVYGKSKANDAFAALFISIIR